jgi:hypothetical protein
MTWNDDSESAAAGAFEIPPAATTWFDGFRVEGPCGAIGLVDELVPAAGTGPWHLLVRAGRAGHLLFLISTDEIEAIFPDRRQILLRRAHVAEARHAA